MTSLHQALRGRFIVFDGPDGGGKSTQIGLLGRHLSAHDAPVTVTRDPGGTVIGERVRGVLLDHDLSLMDVRCEALLFMASRAQLMAEVIAPALARGDVVLCDRFVSATCAYQGAAGADQAGIIELARYAIGDRWPDLTILLDVPCDLGARRRADQPDDAMEARPSDFHERVRQRFNALGEAYPSPIARVDASADPDAVHLEVLEALAARFGSAVC
jgi:dTMP kinase